jgi:hypothetical protein
VYLRENVICPGIFPKEKQIKKGGQNVFATQKTFFCAKLDRAQEIDQDTSVNIPLCVEAFVTILQNRIPNRQYKKEARGFWR